MILDTVLATIRRHTMLRPEDRVVVAVSGGPDSVALLHLLIEARERLPLSLTIAHLDHALRGKGSEGDRAFVEDLARRLELPFVSERIDVAALAKREKRSIEEAGRRARRSFLRDAAARAGARRIALGHHLDDQAESVLLRLIAGSGRSGLGGIRPVSERVFVRPLFDCRRSEILAWLDERRIPFRTDPSNADPRYSRNRLRHRVLPLLEGEFNPRVVQAIARTASLLREEDRYLEREAARALERILLPPIRSRLPIPRPVAPSAATASPEGAVPPEAPRRGSGPLRTALVPDPVRTALTTDPARSARVGPPDAPLPSAALSTLGAAAVLLDASSLGFLSPPIARRVVRLALRHAGLSGRDLAAGRIDEILRLASRRGSNASLSIGGGLAARVEYGRLQIAPHAPGSTIRVSVHGVRERCGPVGSSSSEPRTGARAQMEVSQRSPDAGAQQKVPYTSMGHGTRSGSPTPTTGRRSESDHPSLRPSVPAESGFSDPGSRARVELSVSEQTTGPATVLAEGLSTVTRPDAERAEPDGRGIEGRARDGSWRLPLPGSLAVLPAGVTLHARRIARPALETAFRRAPPFCAYLDAARIVSPLVVRSPRPGDRYRPLGSPGSRKLSDLWTDAKLPRESRRRCLVVESGGEIVWVVGMRPAENVKVAESTLEVALLEALPSDGILYTAVEITAAVDRLAREVAVWARGGEIVVLGVLQGSFMFLADLARRLPDPVRIGFLDRMGAPLGGPLEIRAGRVLLVEDILDTGRSLARVLERVRSAGPAEVRTCVLFDKPAGRKTAIEADFAGLLVPDRWVVGYGLDQEGRHRNLPWLSWVPGGPGSVSCNTGGSDVE